MMTSDYFTFAQSALVYSVDELEKADLENFLRLVRSKKNQNWSPEMIETHLVANVAHRIKKQYPNLKKEERLGIAEEMITAMIERIIKEEIDLQ
jgi:hypothetical protein